MLNTLEYSPTLITLINETLTPAVEISEVYYIQLIYNIAINNKRT